MDKDNIISNIKKKVIPTIEKTSKDIEPTLKYIEKNIKNILAGLLITLLIIFSLSIFSTSIANSTLNEKIELIKEANKPVDISIIIIDCKDCSNISNTINSIKSQNINITNEKDLDYNSNEAKKLISKYNIQKLPTIIISGDVNNKKINYKGFQKIENSLIFNNTVAPYFDLNSETIKGKVSIIEIIDSSCENCIPLTSMVNGLAQSGVFIDNSDKFEYNSKVGKDMINKYGVKNIPALLISEDIDYYPELSKSLSKIGADKKNGYYLFYSPIPPYRDLTLNKVVGLVDLVLLTDVSCAECYDVNVNKQIIASLGVALNSENVYDVNSGEGKALISKYNITKAPMILLSPNAEKYSSFVQAWKGVGSVESDGWFIMRSPEAVGASINLKTEQMVAGKR